MRISRLISECSTLLTFTTAFAIFQPASLAGPRLLYYYDYLNMNTVNCVSIGYQILAERSLQVPSKIEREGEPVFAVGENQSITAFIDCSEVANSGRVTVMASSNDPNFNLSYLRGIFDSLKSFER